MNLIRQPENSYQCGQACVAMLAACPLDEVVGMLGVEPTDSAKVFSAAFQNGVILEAERPKPCWAPEDMPPIALLWLPGSGSMKHLVVRYGSEIFDPGRGVYSVYELDFPTAPAHRVLKFSGVTQCNVPQPAGLLD